MKITSKQQMYELLQSGQLGNTMPSWPIGTIPPVPVGMRCKKPGGLFIMNVDPRTIGDTLNKFEQPWDKYVLQANPPDDKRILNAEVVWGSYYPTMLVRYNAIDVTDCRTAMRSDNAKEVTGALARAVLAHALWLPDREDLYHLLDTYENAVVELSAFDTEVGTIPGHNTIIWEVRNY